MGTIINVPYDELWDRIEREEYRILRRQARSLPQAALDEFESEREGYEAAAEAAANAGEPVPELPPRMARINRQSVLNAVRRIRQYARRLTRSTMERELEQRISRLERRLVEERVRASERRARLAAERAREAVERAQHEAAREEERWAGREELDSLQAEVDRLEATLAEMGINSNDGDANAEQAVDEDMGAETNGEA